MNQCKVCNSTIPEGDYCDAHLIAKKNLEANFKRWQKAYGELSWLDYLSRLVSDPDIPIGDWAKEVAEQLLQEEKKK